MKKLLLLVFLPLVIFAQESYVGELRIDLINCGGSVNITFTLTAIGARWDANYDLTENYESVSDVVTSCTEYAAFDHILDPSPQNPEFAVGLYKISVIENVTDNLLGRFYMDWRTSDWSASLDVAFKYDVGNNRFRDWDNTQTIDYTYQTLWDLTDNVLETTGLEDYWDHCIVITNDGNNYPRVVWGPHPSFTTTHFKIYRGISNHPVNPLILTYYLIGTTNSTTYELINNDFIIEVTPTHYAYYYVKAYNSSNGTYSSRTNIVNTSGQYVPNKIAVDKPNENQPLGFGLDQNYPNPFNSSTTIEYILPEKNYVSLKVYDILGREVTTLVNEVKEAGIHSIEFNASELTSGIYLYRIQSGTYSETRKLILQK